MNPPIFVSIITKKDPDYPITETIRYDKFVRKLLKGESANQEARHWALGMLGEVAELFEPDQSRSYYLKELGDFYFYFQCGLNHYRLDKITPVLDVQTLGQDIHRILLVQVGQFTDLVKKDVVYNKPLDTAALHMKACHILHTFNQLCKYHGTYIGDVLQLNAEKLADRYIGLTYSDQAAQTRADETGESDGTQKR